MTVCVAAIARGKAIVTCSDTKLSVGHTSADLVMLKIEKIHPSWHAMIAGKVAQKFPLLELLRERLGDISAPSAKQVRAVAAKAYAEYGRSLAAEKVLSPYDMTLAEFLSSREKLGDVIYQQLISDIGRVQVGCDLLIVGHEDNNKYPKLIVATNPTDDHPSFTTDYPSFAAIGSGGYLADTILHSFRQFPGDTVESTIYNIACAKFMAEAASDVGESTHLQVIYSDGSRKRLNVDFVDKQLRAAWKRSGKPKENFKILPTIAEAVDKTSSS